MREGDQAVTHEQIREARGIRDVARMAVEGARRAAQRIRDQKAADRRAKAIEAAEKALEPYELADIAVAYVAARDAMETLHKLALDRNQMIIAQAYELARSGVPHHPQGKPIPVGVDAALGGIVNGGPASEWLKIGGQTFVQVPAGEFCASAAGGFGTRPTGGSLPTTMIEQLERLATEAGQGDQQ